MKQIHPRSYWKRKHVKLNRLQRELVSNLVSSAVLRRWGSQRSPLSAPWTAGDAPGVGQNGNAATHRGLAGWWQVRMAAHSSLRATEREWFHGWELAQESLTFNPNPQVVSLSGSQSFLICKMGTTEPTRCVCCVIRTMRDHLPEALRAWHPKGSHERPALDGALVQESQGGQRGLPWGSASQSQHGVSCSSGIR